MIRAFFTCGDVNGIGPEISLKGFDRIFSSKSNNQITFGCPKNFFHFYYNQINAKIDYHFVDDPERFSNSYLNVVPLPDVKVNPGKITIQSGRTSYQSILKSIGFIKNNSADVLITSPISKEAINKSGVSFIGHTELLASSEKNKNYLMMFLSKKLNAALLSIHEPIKKVSALISSEKIISAIELLNLTAVKDLGITNPRIAVLGLNPHAGENGLIGDEEIKIIIPAIKKLKDKYFIDGPFVPDAFWGNKTYKHFDIILGMYHDQVLIPFKLMNFNSGVNFTAGLNLIRTSPDHGTAFDIAGKNIADDSSLYQSYKYAVKIFRNRKKYFASTNKS